MSETFKAIVVNQTEKDFTREVKSINKNFLIRDIYFSRLILVITVLNQ